MHSVKLLLLFIAFILSACVQVPVKNESRVSNLAVTSVWDIPTKFASRTKYSISPHHLEKVSNKHGEIKSAYHRYADGIKKNLNSHSYQEVQDANAAVFHVSFILALSKDLDDQTISEKFGITPGLQESQGLDKGSVLVTITDANTGQRIWHGAIQGFVQQDATQEELERHRNYVINMLLAQFHKSH